MDDSFRSYDTVTKTWECIKPMSERRHSASAAILNGLIYVVGGVKHSNQLTLVEAYDPKTDEWNRKMSFDAVANRVRPILVALNGFLYAFPDKHSIRKYDSENQTHAEVSSFTPYKQLHSLLNLRILFSQIRPNIDHNIRSIIAANGRLFTITTNGSYGYAAIDGSENKISIDYRGETNIPKDLSDTHYITLLQCPCDTLS